MIITAHFSRKINHSHYGGLQYETSDVSISLQEEQDNVLQGDLMRTAREIVNKHIAQEIMSISGGIPRAEFNGILDRYIADGSMTSEQYEMMSAYQKEIVQAIKRSKNREKNKTSPDKKYE